MKNLIRIPVRSLVISVFAGTLGLLINVVHPRGIPWFHEPPKEIHLGAVKVSLIDEKEARRHFDDGATIFVDARKEGDYTRSHVKGAIFLPPTEVEQRFPTIEPLIPLESRLILYCYGPECDMAEKVAQFIAQMGYRNMMIMNTGFSAWGRANYPVEGAESSSSPDDTDQGFDHEETEDDYSIALHIKPQPMMKRRPEISSAFRTHVHAKQRTG